MTQEANSFAELSLHNLRILFEGIVQAAAENADKAAIDSLTIGPILRAQNRLEGISAWAQRPVMAINRMLQAAYPIFASQGLIDFDVKALSLSLTEAGRALAQEMASDAAAFDRFFSQTAPSEAAPPTPDDTPPVNFQVPSDQPDLFTPEPPSPDHAPPPSEFDGAAPSTNLALFSAFPESSTDETPPATPADVAAVMPEPEPEPPSFAPAPPLRESSILESPPASDMVDLLGGFGQHNRLTDGALPANTPGKRPRRTLRSTSGASDEARQQPEPPEMPVIDSTAAAETPPVRGRRTGFTSRLALGKERPANTTEPAPSSDSSTHTRQTIGDVLRGENPTLPNRNQRITPLDAQPTGVPSNETPTGQRRRLTDSPPDFRPRGPRATAPKSNDRQEAPKIKRVTFPDGRMMEFDEDILNHLIEELGSLTAVIDWYRSREKDDDSLDH